MLALIRFYQGFISPLMPLGCRFHPSCSHYAYQAIERHGARRGVWLAARRLLRCRPFGPYGYDPVPEAWSAGACSRLHAPKLTSGQERPLAWDDAEAHGQETGIGRRSYLQEGRSKLRQQQGGSNLPHSKAEVAQ